MKNYLWSMNYWNADLVQNGPDVVFTNTDSLPAISAGGSIAFGFQIAYSGTNETPSDFEVN